jgi:uncharacterized protein (TIGR02996 family)
MSNAVDVLRQALRAAPGDEMAWLAFADALEEAGQTDRAERTRRMLRLLDWPERSNSIGMRFALIPAGTFRMGSPDCEEGRSPDEGPVHEVEVTRPFYLSVTPVTQEQYERIMDSNPSHFSATGEGKKKVRRLDTRAFPVECVSWNDAHWFVYHLSSKVEEKEQGRTYRLPSEAEWEYACRAGADSYQVFHFGNSLCFRQANFNGRYPYGRTVEGPFLRRTCKVGCYPANAFGLMDMHSNVHEWCSDRYDESYYAQSPGQDPRGPNLGTERVMRGGCWNSGGQSCRSAFRTGNASGYRSNHLGFRVALVVSGT